MNLHHIEIQHHGSAHVETVATFTEGHAGEAVDSARRIADNFVRMFNDLPSVSAAGRAYADRVDSHRLVIRTTTRRIATVIVVDEHLQD